MTTAEPISEIQKAFMAQENQSQGKPFRVYDPIQTWVVSAFGIMVLGLTTWALAQVNKDSGVIQAHTAQISHLQETLSEIKNDIRELRHAVERKQ